MKKLKHTWGQKIRHQTNRKVSHKILSALQASL